MNIPRAHIIPAFCALLLTTATATAQICRIDGTVTDTESKKAIADASVTYKINEKQYNLFTDGSGQFTFTIPQGSNTTVSVSHMGYKKTTKLVVAGDKRQRAVEIALTPVEVEIKEAVVKGHIPLITQRGDTTIYKASDYKVNRDATAWDMISQKLPGVGTKDGKLEAHGEQVKVVEIDGREYFKDDISMALKNLPANIINEIQVYDQLSDYSKLTGFDDGNTKKAINITTVKGTKKSQFGKAVAGGGIDNVHKLYGMYNLFHNDIRWSVFAQWNNINEQNFSMIDLLSATGTASSSAPGQSPYSKGATDNTFHPTTTDDISSMLVDVSDYGVTKSRAVGTNYTDEWADGKMKFSGHYLFNSSSNYTDYHIYDTYFGETASNNLQDMKVNNHNRNHRFNTKYEYQITPKDYFMLRPAVAYQKKREEARLNDWTVAATDTAALLNQYTYTDQYVASLSTEAMLMHKFDSLGHTLSADARISYIHTHEDISMNFANVQTNESALQSTMAKNTQQTYTYIFSYIHPFNRHQRVKLDAGWNKTYGLMRRCTLMNANGSGTFSIDSLLSGSTWSHFGGLLANASYMVSYPKLSLVAGTEFQAYDLYNSNDRYYFKRSYQTFFPYAIMRYRLNRGQLLVQYKASHKYPGLAQVHDAINNSNAVMAIRGSIKLEPAYQHTLMTRLVLPVAKNGSVFVFFVNLEQADNYIGSLRSLSSESFQETGERRNTEILSYKNCDGYFSSSALFAYGIPWKLISSNVNFSTTAKYSKIPGYWDNNKQFTKQWNWSGSLTIGSNISENVDFVLDVNGKYNKSANQTFSDYNIHYWSLSYGGQLNWQFVKSLKLVVECGRTNYFGSGTSRYNAVISNAALAYKFMKGRKGELRFSIHDIFNEDNSFYQTTTEMYRREMTTNILGRYALLTFTYNLNTNK